MTTRSSKDEDILFGSPPRALSHKLLLATPWNVSFVSTGFCLHLKNLHVPIPHTFIFMRARHVSDARNAICIEAQKRGATHVMMIDADNYVPQDAFTRLWAILEREGHENTIAYGWTVLKSGEWANKPGVFRTDEKGGFRPIDDIVKQEQPISVDAVGTSCLLFSLKVLEKVRPPWFSDIFVLRPEDKFSEGGDHTIYCPTEYREGQDLTFSMRMKNAGVKLVVDPKMKLLHELTGTI